MHASRGTIRRGSGIGLRRAAEAGLRLLPSSLRADLEAYAAGVSAAIVHEKLPIEFVLLRYRPEPWTVLDTLVWGKMMAWNLSVNWESELLRASLVARLGPERAAELEPGPPSRVPRIVPPGVDYSCLGQEALRRAREARRFTGPTAQEGLGSNNWVIAGSRTATGAPVLANDMHLLLGMPAIWYENHLAGGDLDVTGVTFPGIPGVVAGHNGHVAWGFTAGLPDVQDLYIERLQRLDDGRVHYEFRGEWHDATVIREEIAVRGQAAAVEEVIVTCHGPVINTLAPELAGDRAQRIVELIEAKAGIDLAYTQEMQFDQLSPVARTVAGSVIRLGASWPEPAAWAWGRLHRLTFGHVLGRGRPLARLFSRGPYPIGGDGTTLWAASGAGADLRRETLSGPPFRFIADLRDLRRSLGLLAPGQSGRPGSPHYDDQVEAWFHGAYHPMLYDRKDVEHAATDRLKLLPPS